MLCFFSCNYGLALFFKFVKSYQANSLIQHATVKHRLLHFPFWLTVFFIFWFPACPSRPLGWPFFQIFDFQLAFLALLVDCFLNFLISSLPFSPSWLTVFSIFQFPACLSRPLGWLFSRFFDFQLAFLALSVDCFLNFLISGLSFSPNWLTVFFIFQFMACIFDFSHIMISTNKKHPPERLNPKIHLPKKVLFN